MLYTNPDRPDAVFMAKQYCGEHDDGGRAIYTLRCARTGESQDVVVCMKHGEKMPLIDGDLVTARPADGFIKCDYYKMSDAEIRELAKWFAGNWGVTDLCRHALEGDVHARKQCATLYANHGER